MLHITYDCGEYGEITSDCTFNCTWMGNYWHEAQNLSIVDSGVEKIKLDNA
jgi:hypothetical protein